ncbi:MAG TPA: glycosyltransferase family 2 protein [Chthoniobacterales bacterium]
MKIVGIMLVRDEDRFVEWAIRNAIDFCDEFLVCDHESQDETTVILGRLTREFGRKLVVRRCRDSGESHRMIQAYAGTNTWVFGVDGDEIYDPAGLRRMRARLEAGEFDAWWAVFGNVLNVKRLDFAGVIADGHLAPPCRSMTKLYNFAAIDAWNGKIVERLHGGEIRFRSGFDATKRLNLHDQSTWADADFRCLHLCFLDRSSRDAGKVTPRRNIMDRHAWSLGKLVARVRAAITGRRAEDWKEQKYARGPLVTESIAAFLSPAISGS